MKNPRETYTEKCQTKGKTSIFDMGDFILRAPENYRHHFFASTMVFLAYFRMQCDTYVLTQTRYFSSETIFDVLCLSVIKFNGIQHSGTIGCSEYFKEIERNECTKSKK